MAEAPQDPAPGGFVLFAAATPVVAQPQQPVSKRDKRSSERWATARWRLLPERRRPRVYDHRRDGHDPGVFGYEAWVGNALLARLPSHGKVRTGGLVCLKESEVEHALDPALAKKLKARAKNQRRRHAKQAAKKAAAAAAATTAATETGEARTQTTGGGND